MDLRNEILKRGRKRESKRVFLRTRTGVGQANIIKSKKFLDSKFQNLIKAVTDPEENFFPSETK